MCHSGLGHLVDTDMKLSVIAEYNQVTEALDARAAATTFN